MHATDSVALRKARGAFFTPPEVASFIADWAVRSAADRTFEPSCGEASFMLAAAQRLRALGASGALSGQIEGVELHRASATAAEEQLRGAEVDAAIRIGDFFSGSLEPAFDAVIGNPPYVRYQDFVGEARVQAREAALATGVRLSGLASSWAAFVVASARLLKPDGRLGLVLPAELLSVNYAGPVRRYLMERFGRVKLVVFDERVFPGVLEEVVLLLADGEGPTAQIEVAQARNLDGLGSLTWLAWSPLNTEEKWTPALLPPEAIDAYCVLRDDAAFIELEEWGATDLGMVTGNNGFFALNRADAEALGLPGSEVAAISPPGSRHLRGLTFTQAAWDELAGQDRPVYLFLPPIDEPSPEAMRYVRRGKRAKVHRAYKCRVRDPWWRVPTVPAPDLFLTYMNHDTPRLVLNEARVGYLNSIHGVRLKRQHRAVGRELLPIGALNSLTLLGAELVGRSYGGGLLKVEPKEADRLPVPAPESLKSARDDLRALVPHVSNRLRSGDLGGAVTMVDRVLLAETLGVRRSTIAALRAAREQLFARRAARARDP